METNNFQAAFLRFVDFSQLTNWEVRANHNNVGIFSQFEIISLRDVLNDLTSMRRIKLLDDIEYQEPTLSSKDNSISIRKKGKGLDFKVKKRVLIQKDDLVISKMHTQNGLFAFADQEYHSTSTFIPFAIRKNIDRNYLFILLKPTLARLYKNDTVNRETYSVDEILDLKIPLPDINTQKALVQAYQDKMAKADELEKQANQIDDDIEQYLFEQLGIEIYQTPKAQTGKLRFVNFRDLILWGVAGQNAITAETIFKSNQFKNEPITTFFEINPTTQIPSNKIISFIPMANVSDVYGEISIYDKQTLKPNYTKFKENDLLWAKITPCMENGKSAVATNLENGFGFGSTEFHVLRAKNEKFFIHLLHLLLRTKHLRKIATQYFTGSSGQQRVPKSFLEDLTLPVLNIETQTKIVAYIQSLKQQQKSNLEIAATYRIKALIEFERAIFQ